MGLWSPATQDQGLAHLGTSQAPTWHVPTSPVAQGERHLGVSLPALLLMLMESSSGEEDGLPVRAREN